MLPTYTKGEEIFNMTSHIFGAAVGVITLIACILIAAIHRNVYGLISGIIFSISIILLYTMSSIYHGLRPGTAKKVMQIIDHCTIFILIAGSYTPFLLCIFRKHSLKLAYGMLIFLWVVAIIGIILNSIDLKRYKAFSMICYLAMGWCIVFKFSLLVELLGKTGVLLLLLGGISYTLGAVFYGIGKKKKYMHSIFHLFIDVGSIFQIICVLIYVM